MARGEPPPGAECSCKIFGREPGKLTCDQVIAEQKERIRRLNAKLHKMTVEQMHRFEEER